MGFYQPAQLLRDARAHGVEVRPVDVRVSDVDCTLERGEGGSPGAAAGPALRALAQRRARASASSRRARMRPSRICATWATARGLSRHDMEALAAAGALAGFDGHRHLAFWRVAGYLPPLPAAPDAGAKAPSRCCARPPKSEDIVADYRALGFTLGRHPLALLRERLAAARVLSAAGAGGAGQWRDGAGGGPRHHAPAAADRQRRHLRDAGR